LHYRPKPQGQILLACIACRHLSREAGRPRICGTSPHLQPRNLPLANILPVSFAAAAVHTFFQVAPPPIPLAYRLNLFAMPVAVLDAYRPCASPIRCQRRRFLPETSRLTAVASFHGTCAGAACRQHRRRSQLPSGRSQSALSRPYVPSTTCKHSTGPECLPGHTARPRLPLPQQPAPTPTQATLPDSSLSTTWPTLQAPGDQLPAARVLPALVMPVAPMVTWLAGRYPAGPCSALCAAVRPP